MQYTHILLAVCVCVLHAVHSNRSRNFKRIDEEVLRLVDSYVVAARDTRDVVYRYVTAVRGLVTIEDLERRQGFTTQLRRQYKYLIHLKNSSAARLYKVL